MHLSGFSYVFSRVFLQEGGAFGFFFCRLSSLFILPVHCGGYGYFLYLLFYILCYHKKKKTIVELTHSNDGHFEQLFIAHAISI